MGGSRFVEPTETLLRFTRAKEILGQYKDNPDVALDVEEQLKEIEGEMWDKATNLLKEEQATRNTTREVIDRVLDEIVEPIPLIPRKLSDDFTEDEVANLRALHFMPHRVALQEELNLDITRLPLQTQLQLSKFVLNGDNERFERFATAMRRNNNDEDIARHEFCEAFLATEFGDELGDAVLDIYEYCDKNDVIQIFKEVATFRAITPQIKELFSKGNKELAEQVESAFLKRISEVLAVAAQIGTAGKAEATLYNNETITFDSMHDILERLQTLNVLYDDVWYFANDGSF